ncbi:TIM barrel protein [Palleronia abyssalis]|uniref:Inosose dehydratase n=1 Tax=Palleronia abyssalis TaxID=1501240 RepID=A0A2R8BTJ0_9RHOB|nr:TIM barrel protein [Palleronia abyssalis]SPJ23448.1 Inosose dehydratase [Palleronia abyssalis]
MLRIATTPALWFNEDDTALAAGLSVEDMLSRTAELEITGIEDGRGLPDDAGALKSALDAQNMTLVAAHHGLSLLSLSVEEEQKALDPVLERMDAVGCKTLILREMSNAIVGTDKPMSQKPTLSATDWDSFGLKLEQIATWLTERGITPVYQPYAGTVVHTPDEIDRLMMETGPNLFLAFDSAQVYVGGGEPTQVLTRHLPRVRHVHLGDVRVRPLTKSRMSDTSWAEAVKMGIFTLPGDRDGSVDFKTILNLLGASDFDGWLTLTAGMDPERGEIAKALGDAQRFVSNLAGRGNLAA